jgi:hypothetical protein
MSDAEQPGWCEPESKISVSILNTHRAIFLLLRSGFLRISRRCHASAERRVRKWHVITVTRNFAKMLNDSP